MAGTLARLAEVGRRVGQAQLLASGCRPLDRGPAPTPDGALAARPELWLAGAARTVALLEAAGPELGAGMARLDPDLLDAVGELAAPPELLAALGGDDRLVPVAGRNGYGLPLYDLDPSVRLSSCTATPPDRTTLDHLDRWRRRMLAEVLRAQAAPDPHRLHAGVATRLVRCLGLPESWSGRVLLAPSGTHLPVVATAIVAAADRRPLRAITVGCLEAGSGTGFAAGGRVFHTRSPFRLDNAFGAVVDGMEGHDVRVVDVDIRDAAGRPRRAFDVEAEIEAHLELALDEGARVLVHAMDESKTGLRQPSLAWVARWREAHPDRLRVVVDGAQGRIPLARLHQYLAAGAAVALTGSKGVGGPAFCGALLLDRGLFGDASELTALPAGFAAFLSRAELPPVLAGAGRSLPAANHGLIARWHAALSEWEGFLAVPDDLRDGLTDAVLGELQARLSSLDGVDVARRPGGTILSCRLASLSGGHLPREPLRAVYRDLVSRPGVQVGQPVELVARKTAALRFAVGGPTVTRLLAAERPVHSGRAMAAEAVSHLLDVVRTGVPST